jgi:hypothetical protein
VRLAGRERLGFYPLPVAEARRIREFLSYPNGLCAALDPCVGDGVAFQAVTSDAQARRYGIELDAYRAEQASSAVEGKLVAPWLNELKTVWEKASVDLNGREVVIELKNVTTISQEAENLLLELMNEGAKFRCCGVFTKEILKHIARRRRRNGAHQ